MAHHGNIAGLLGIGQSRAIPDKLETGEPCRRSQQFPPWCQPLMSRETSLPKVGKNVCSGNIEKQQTSSRGNTKVYGAFSIGVFTDTSRCFSISDNPGSPWAHSPQSASMPRDASPKMGLVLRLLGVCCAFSSALNTVQVLVGLYHLPVREGSEFSLKSLSECLKQPSWC